MRDAHVELRLKREHKKGPGAAAQQPAAVPAAATCAAGHCCPRRRRPLRRPLKRGKIESDEPLLLGAPRLLQLRDPLATSEPTELAALHGHTCDRFPPRNGGELLSRELYAEGDGGCTDEVGEDGVVGQAAWNDKTLTSKDCLEHITTITHQRRGLLKRYESDALPNLHGRKATG